MFKQHNLIRRHPWAMDWSAAFICCSLDLVANPWAKFHRTADFDQNRRGIQSTTLTWQIWQWKRGKKAIDFDFDKRWRWMEDLCAPKIPKAPLLWGANRNNMKQHCAATGFSEPMKCQCQWIHGWEYSDISRNTHGNYQTPENQQLFSLIESTHSFDMIPVLPDISRVCLDKRRGVGTCSSLQSPHATSW